MPNPNPQTTRCKHGMLFPERTCGVCMGLIRAANQTRTYHGAEREPGIGYKPMVSMRMSYPQEREIGIARVIENPPKVKEMRMEVKAESKWPLCPICKVNASPGRRQDGQLKMCGECRKAAAAKGAREKAEREKQNIPENIPKVIPISSTVSPSGKDAIFIRAMDELEALLGEHIQSCRDIHRTMLALKQVMGVDYEIKMPSLVG